MADRDRTAGRSAEWIAAHQTTQELIPVYATYAAQGRQLEQLDPTVAAHLAECAFCRAELEALIEISMPVFAGQFPSTSLHRPADLSFLPHRQQSKVWHLDALGRLVILFSQSFLDSLRPMTLAGAARGQLLYSYQLEPRSGSNLNITFEVFAVDQQPTLASARVHVELTDRDAFDQEGSMVSLDAEGHHWSGIANDIGDIVFENIPRDLLPHLRVEILPPPSETS